MFKFLSKLFGSWEETFLHTTQVTYKMSSGKPVIFHGSVYRFTKGGANRIVCKFKGRNWDFDVAAYEKDGRLIPLFDVNDIYYA